MRPSLWIFAFVFAFAAPLAAADTKSQVRAGQFEAPVGETNPWTNLNFDRNPNKYHFAIVSDRTAPARIGVFHRALRKLNWLRPEFVISVGDLIDGWVKIADYGGEWNEFNERLKDLRAPFFFVPGNHDVANTAMKAEWSKRYGRLNYWFRYNRDLFVVLNSEEQMSAAPPQITEDQVLWLRTVLTEQTDPRWIFVFLHQPLWLPEFKVSNWEAVEAAFGGRRNVWVFAGHTNVYSETVRNGRHLYNLSVTGSGPIPPKGLSSGTFDHVAWITASDDGPSFANILLSGLFSDNPLADIQRDGLPLAYQNLGDKRAVKLMVDARVAEAAEQAREKALAQVRNSTSWRVTAPLRWIKCWISTGQSCSGDQQ